MLHSDEYYIELALTTSLLDRGSGVYLTDLQNNRLLFHTDHQVLLGNLSPECLKSNGIQVIQDIIHPKERLPFERVFGSLANRLQPVTTNVLNQVVVCMDFHIITAYRPIMVQHKMVFLGNEKDTEKPRFMLGKVSPSIAPQYQCYYGNRAEAFQYLFDTNEWHRFGFPSFNTQEIEMLRLALQGFSVEKSASLMCKSKDTIKYYRRSVFEKLGCKNIQQAAVIATAMGIL